MLSDLRYALRLLHRSPGFTVTALITLALGLGANIAVFTVVRAVLLQPPPFPGPERLVLLWQVSESRGFDRVPFSFPNFQDIRDGVGSFDALGAWSTNLDTRFNLVGAGRTDVVRYALANPGFFDALGVKAAIGRTLQAQDDRRGAPAVVLLSDRLWRQRFNADPAIVGHTLSLDDAPYAVVGVMPPTFRFPRWPDDVDVWVPLMQDPHQGREYSRGTRYLNVIARLRPGATLEQAASRLRVLAARQAKAFPAFNRDLDIRARPLGDEITAPLRPSLLALSAAVALVMLIACVNLANMLLARVTAREQEFAVRLAIGASRWRVLRQLLTESLVLGILGGAGGLIVASWIVDAVSLAPYLAPSYVAPYSVSAEAVRPDAAVVVFTLLLTLASSVLVGALPALRSARPSVSHLTRRQTVGERRRPLAGREALVAVETALALLLLVSAGLVTRSLVRLAGVDPGFDRTQVLVTNVRLAAARYPDPPRINGFYERLIRRTRALPGVSNTAAISLLPFSGADPSTGFFIDGQPLLAPADRPRTSPRAVTPGYFEVMGIALRQGRDFTDSDAEGAPRVAIVDEAMARRYWRLGENPVGRRIALDLEAYRFYRDRPPELDIAAGLRTIVGVVGGVRQTGLDTDAKPTMYVPAAQQPSREMTLVVRASSAPGVLERELETVVRAIDPEQPVPGVRALDALVAASLARPRLNANVLNAFGMLALLLAVTGLYGVTLCVVNERTREFAVRLALGAEPRDIVWLMLRRSSAVVGAGLACGLAAAAAASGLIRSLLFGVGALDVATYIAAALLMSAVAAVGCYVPARRVFRMDPNTALRSE